MKKFFSHSKLLFSLSFKRRHNGVDDLDQKIKSMKLANKYAFIVPFLFSALFIQISPRVNAQGFTEVFPGVLTGCFQSSVEWGDYDNDGDLDILITGYNQSVGNVSKIYQNTGSGFTEVFAGDLTEVSGGDAAWGDYDNDGDLDILLTGWDYDLEIPVSKIYQNTGTGFTEVLAGSITPVFLGDVAWGDYDNDGDLDILVTGYIGAPSTVNVSKIYQNTGSGFSEVFAGALTTVVNSSVAWGDYDSDGDLDILLTGYNNGLGPISKIYQNAGSGFTEVFAGSLTGVYTSSVKWGDYDNDGDLDILLTGHNGGLDFLTSLISKIYQNTGSGFIEVFAGSLPGVYHTSVAWGDYDNDNDLDILLTGYDYNTIAISKTYQNTGSGFSEVFVGSLAGAGEGSSDWGDYDNDGDLDILLTGYNSSTGGIAKIYQNLDPGQCEGSVSVGTDEWLYFGYGPDQCVSKAATPTNGTAPYTYQWTLNRPLLSDVITSSGDESMSGANSATVTVCLLDTATLCVIVTDANGCTFTDCATIFAEDARCFAGNSGNHKIKVCHNGHEICIDSSAVAAHLAHGDYVGPCVANRANLGELEVEQNLKSGFNVYPNPSKGDLFVTMNLAGDETKDAIIQVIGINGQIIKQMKVNNQNRLNFSIKESGLYFFKLMTNKEVYTRKVTVIQ